MSSKDTSRSTTRRRTIQATGAALTGPAIASMVRGETSSGEIEAEVTATIPAQTEATVVVSEFLSGGGELISNSQSRAIQDGTNTYVFDELQGGEDDGHEYRLDVEPESLDGSETPVIDAVTVTLPEGGIDPGPGDEDPDGPEGVSDGQQDIGDLWDNFLVTTTLSILIIGAIGLASRSLAVASVPAYLLFAHIAIETGHPLLENVLYVTVVLIMVGMAFKLWRLEGSGST